MLGIAAVAVAVALLTFFYFSSLAGKIWLLLSLALILTGLVLLLLHQKRILRDQLVLSREMAQWEGDRDGLSAAQPLVLQELFTSFRKMVARLSRRMLSGEEKLLQTEQALDKEIKIHKSLEQALQKSETIFQQLWQISADGMRLTDADGTILQVNNAFCEMVGLPREELIGQPFSVVYQETIQEEMLTAYRQHFVNNQIMPHQDGERRLWNGRTVWFAFSNSFLELHDSGRLLLSIIKDITLRKKAELELKESERRFRLLFNHANDAIFVNPLVDDYKLGAFMEVNNVACQRLLYAREELLALNPYSIIPERYYDAVHEVVKKLKEKGQAIFEIEHLRKDNRRIPVEISAILFEYKNVPTILSIARDITQRKRDEARLRATSQKLRNLASRIQTVREEERTLIAREIHDELGQMLTVLKIQLSLLGQEIAGSQPEYSQKIRQISTLIDQTVESVQRITAKLRPDILDELGLVPAIEWQASEFSALTGIQCKCSLTAEDVRLSQEKATAVFRIFQEALTNVARHAGASRVSIFLRHLDRRLVLEITDNGRGITPAQKNDPRSLGILGMKERAVLFGGNVTIHGTPDKGSNVKVEIPLSQDEFSPAP